MKPDYVDLIQYFLVRFFPGYLETKESLLPLLRERKTEIQRSGLLMFLPLWVTIIWTFVYCLMYFITLRCFIQSANDKSIINQAAGMYVDIWGKFFFLQRSVSRLSFMLCLPHTHSPMQTYPIYPC